MHLLNEHWELIQPLLEQKVKPRPGRPAQSPRQVLEGVLWICKTGAQWNTLPVKYPPYQTCHRTYLKWRRSGILKQVLLILQQEVQKHYVLDDQEQVSNSIQIDLTQNTRVELKYRKRIAEIELLLHSVYSQAILNESLPASES